MYTDDTIINRFVEDYLQRYGNCEIYTCHEWARMIDECATEDRMKVISAMHTYKMRLAAFVRHMTRLDVLPNEAMVYPFEFICKYTGYNDKTELRKIFLAEQLI